MLVVTLAIAMSLALVAGAAAQSSSVTVPLATQNGSGVSGTATLTAVGNQTQVVINVTGEPAGGSEPEHIHVGSCPGVGAVKYPLASVVNGTATTTVNVALSALQTGGFAINLHKSAAEISVYIACGNIPAAAAATTTSSTPATTPSTGGGALATSGETALPLAIIIAGGLLVVSVAGRRRAA